LLCVLQVNPESLLMLHGHAADEAGSGDAGLFLHAGLSNGVMTRTEVDRITGGHTHRLFRSHLQHKHRTTVDSLMQHAGWHVTSNNTAMAS
jgi:hypothetical protein